MPKNLHGVILGDTGRSKVRKGGDLGKGGDPGVPISGPIGESGNPGGLTGEGGDPNTGEGGDPPRLFLCPASRA